MLHWERQGVGADVILLHGFLASGCIFDPLTQVLSESFRVTTIDLPGFGGSVEAPVPETVEAITTEVVGTILSSGVSEYAVLGHSLGAMIALEIGIEHGERLRKMVLYGGCPDGYLPLRFESTEQSIDNIRSLGIDAVAAEIAAKWFVNAKADPMYPFAVKAGAKVDQAGAIRHIRSWDAWTARDRLSRVSTPTLIVCGDSDRSTHPTLSVEMWQGIPGAQLFIAPNAGHAVHLEQQDLFNLVVSRFLSD